MKSTTITIALLFGVFLLVCDAIPAGAERVPYSCNLSQFVANPSTPPKSPLDDKRVPGSGRLFREWKIVRIEQDVYEISGVVVDDNIGLPKENAPIFIGNIGTDNILTLVAKSDNQGRFSFRVNNQIAVQRKNRLAKTKSFEVVSSKEWKALHDALYIKHKYVYVGESNVDLYRYEIPYSDAEPARGPYAVKRTIFMPDVFSRAGHT